MFSVALNLRHLPRIVVLIEYAPASPRVAAWKKPHEHGRTACAYEYPMRISGSQRSHFPRHRPFFSPGTPSRLLSVRQLPDYSSPIQFFPVVQNYAILNCNVVLEHLQSVQMLRSLETRMSMRISFAWKNPMRI